MAVDFEAEYDTRAAAPDHPAVFARRERATADYRAQASTEKRAELGVSYGASKRQIIDLFMPKGTADVPLMVFIHGGYWRAGEPAMHSYAARGPNAHGVAVALVGYDLTPQVSIADIIEQVRSACLHLWRRFNRRLFVSGHSAGGHLTACMFATDWNARGAPADLVPVAAATSGMYDLDGVRQTSMNQDFKLDAVAARAISPLFWPPPKGGTIDFMVGGAETNEFRQQSRMLANAWAKEGVATRYNEVAGANHFTLVEPLSDPQSPIVARYVELARKT